MIPIQAVQHARAARPRTHLLASWVILVFGSAALAVPLVGCSRSALHDVQRVPSARVQLFSGEHRIDMGLLVSAQFINDG